MWSARYFEVLFRQRACLKCGQPLIVSKNLGFGWYYIDQYVIIHIQTCTYTVVHSCFCPYMPGSKTLSVVAWIWCPLFHSTIYGDLFTLVFVWNTSREKYYETLHISFLLTYYLVVVNQRGLLDNIYIFISGDSDTDVFSGRTCNTNIPNLNEKCKIPDPKDGTVSCGWCYDQCKKNEDCNNTPPESAPGVRGSCCKTNSGCGNECQYFWKYIDIHWPSLVYTFVNEQLKF